MSQKDLDTAKNAGEIIPVFFNADDNYVVQLYIAVFSMMYNYKGAAYINAYVLNSDGFSEKSMALLNSLTERFDKLNITILNMDNKYENVDISQAYISNASMYRLEIPRIVESMPDIQSDKCIYIDCDLVVEGDISELFNEDISGYYIGGIADPMQVFKKYSKYAKNIGIPDRKQYINSGVLLMNLKEINSAPEVRENLEQAGLNENLLFKDQDAINVALYGGIKLLPIKYNAFPIIVSRNEKRYYKLYGKKNMKEAKANPLIVHYIGFFKPWSFTTEYMSNRWWKYVKMQDKAIKREYINPFVKENKIMSLPDTLLLAIRGRLRSTGRYYELYDKKNKYVFWINKRLQKYNP